MWQEAINTARPELSRLVRTRGVNLVAHSLMMLRFGPTGVTDGATALS
jgi:hypothetical protein